MKVETKKLDKVKRVIKVDIRGEEFLKERNAVYEEIGKTLKVPGFRPGSAPLDILEKHHADHLRQAFLEKVLPVYYRRAIEEEKLAPAGLPRVYDVIIDKESLAFCAEFEVKPEVDLKENDYKGIKIKDRKVEVKEEEIEKVLTNLKEGIKKLIDKDLADEELAKWAGYPTVLFFREAIKTEIFAEKLRDRRRKIDAHISQELLRNIKFDIPAGEVDRHHKELVDREIYNLRLKGVSEEDMEKYKKDVEEKLRPFAEDEVKLFYILEAIARKENLKIDNNLGEVVLGFILNAAQYEG
jgi:FKBP-type peptidyl-prolyl cis-trans isomerase (trigger factor)